MTFSRSQIPQLAPISIGARDPSCPIPGSCPAAARRFVPARHALAAAAALLISGCTTVTTTQIEPKQVAYPAIDVAVYRRAESEKAARLAKDVERLRADLRQAEEALITAESGLRGSHSRADAVSSLAETRIAVERAATLAPWRSAEVAEAWSKLEEGARQVDQAHFGAALFFVYRAQRIADTLEAEAKSVLSTPGTRFVRGRRVNLRAGPSTSESVLAVLQEGTPVFSESQERLWVLVRTSAGSVGWVHGGLLTPKQAK